MYNIKHMNTIIYQTIRAGAVLGVALFAFASNAFAAAPVLLPVSVTEVTNTSVVLRDYIQSYGDNSVAWFEWSEASSISAPTFFAMRGFYGDGLFEARLEGLTPGATYSFRAAARAGGVTVYSPALTFTTLSSKPAPVVSQSVTQTSVSKTIQTKTQTVQTVAVKQATVVAAPAKEGFTNGNSAAVIGAGNSLLPSTLLGWVALLVAILLVVLLGHMIYEAPEKLRKEREKEEERTRRESM